MTEQVDGQVSLFAQDSWFGKTYQEPSVPALPRERTSQPSLKKSSKSANREPMCLCVYQATDGLNRGATTLRMVPGALLGEFTMHSFGESPSEENASRLSQILEDSPPLKYCLSERACRGILNRAARRGKELPKELRDALEQQALRDPQN